MNSSVAMVPRSVVVVGTPSIDEWLDERHAAERRTIEFRCDMFLSSHAITCILWVHNFRGISLHSAAKAQNSGDAFALALAKIQQVMESQA